MLYIKDELIYRCEDAIKPLIDEFLVALGDFLRITKDFHDQSFLEPFYDNSFGLFDKLQLFALKFKKHSGEDEEWDSKYVTYTVSKINDMLTENGHFDWDFKDWFKTHCLTDECKNTPGYKMLFEIIESAFRNGVPILNSEENE